MNDASYVAKAVPLATDTARLVELRAGLRERPLA
jgi:predicted O-linked N-acetylglucosamine transferase (SPINDLY family)